MRCVLKMPKVLNYHFSKNNHLNLVIQNKVFSVFVGSSPTFETDPDPGNYTDPDPQHWQAGPLIWFIPWWGLVGSGCARCASTGAWCRPWSWSSPRLTTWRRGSTSGCWPPSRNSYMLGILGPFKKNGSSAVHNFFLLRTVHCTTGHRGSRFSQSVLSFKQCCRSGSVLDQYLGALWIHTVNIE